MKMNVMSELFPTSRSVVKHEPTEALTPPTSPLDLCIYKPSPACNTEISLENSLHSPEESMGMVTSSISSPRSTSSPEQRYISHAFNANYEGLGSKLAPVVTKIKATRPFKAYPRNPMTVTIGSGPIDIVPDSKFLQFRQDVLGRIKPQYNSTTNKNMRRTSNSSSQNEQNNDPSYWEKRKKNNEAAKRSRDARRAKEDEIAIRCAFLEQECIRLKQENLHCKQENADLKLRLAHLETDLRRLQSSIFLTV